MAKKKISLKNLKAQKLSGEEQLQTKGGFYNFTRKKDKGLQSPFRPFRPSIIEDIIDIRFNGGDETEKIGG